MLFLILLFKVSYGLHPLIPLDLVTIPQESKVSFEAKEMGKEMKNSNEQARAQIEKVNEQYKAKAQQETHLSSVPTDRPYMAMLEKGKVPNKKEEQAHRYRRWPYKVVQKLGDNAWKIELLSGMNISTTFNVGDLNPYIDDEYEGNKDLRANPLRGWRLMQSK